MGVNNSRVPPRAVPLIQDLPAEDRPRERLLRNGGSALSDVELLAVLLRTGRPGASVLEVARDLLRSTGGLAGLISSNGNLLRQRGVGAVKASSILAAVELGRRLVRSSVVNRDLLDEPGAVARFVQLRYASLDQEIMGALYLDVRNRLIAESDIYRGTIFRTAVEPRAIMKEALLHSAFGLILFHTHPAGDPAPSCEELNGRTLAVSYGRKATLTFSEPGFAPLPGFSRHTDSGTGLSAGL
jgi:DNA repair protein RadC